MKEKNEFIQAEVEVIRFEKTDVIATSPVSVTVTGPGPMDEEPEENE